MSATSAKFIRHYSVNSRTKIEKLRAKVVKTTRISYRYNGLSCDYVDLEEETTNNRVNASDALNAIQLEIIKNRFDNMKLGISFKDYMTNSDIFKLNSDTNLVVASEVSTEQIPLDGSVELTCTGQDYSSYKVGEKYKIGNSDKSYISKNEKHTATVFDLNNCSYKTQTVYERAHYGQSHWYWKMDEDARFENTELRDTSYAVFTII